MTDLIPNGRTYLLRISRRDFEELPLRFVLIPALDGPRLVFNRCEQGRAAVLEARIAEFAEVFPRTRDGKKRARLARAVRDLHRNLVEIAVGYSWPGNPPGYIKFHPEGSP